MRIVGLGLGPKQTSDRSSEVRERGKERAINPGVGCITRVEVEKNLYLACV